MEPELTSARESLLAKSDMAEFVAEFRIDLRRMERRGIRCLLACMLGQTAVHSGLGYFALTDLRR